MHLSASPANARALLLLNCHARKGHPDQAAEIEQTLEKLGLEVIPILLEPDQSLAETICQYRDQVDRVIVGGGDGTLNGAIAGLIETGLPLALLPLGTANDLARTLQIPTDLTAACEIAATGQVRSIDLGWVNGHYFFNVASLGLSVQITHRLNPEVKRRWGVLAYGLTALQVLWQARPFTAEIHLADQVIWSRTVQIAIGNGRYYGGGLTVAEDATIDDQRLDLYSLEIDHWWQMLVTLPAMRRGNHARWPHVRSLQGQEITIYTRKPYWINTDGELTTQTPATFRVLPGALSVLCPQSES